MRSLKEFLKMHPIILNVVSLCYRILFINRKKIGKENQIECNGTFLKSCKIEVYGNHNKIKIAPLAKLNNCHIFIKGNHNHIMIGSECVINKLEIWIEDTENQVEIGNNCWITGKTHLAVTEGTQLQIGNQCLLSEDIVMRTGDSHSIFDSEGRRINPAESIKIASHVWIGNKTILLKGSGVGENSIIGTGSIVTKSFGEGVLLAGIPAKPIKEHVYWSSERI